MRQLIPALTAVALVATACSRGKEDAPIEVICSYAPSQSSVVSYVAGAAGGAGVAAATIAKAAGLTAVLHSSGAYIFTGASGYLAGTLGTAFVGPVLVGVGVTVAGSAATIELLCVPRNHPELTGKVEQAAKEFAARASTEARNIIGGVSPLAASVQKSIVRTGQDAIAYANRKSTQISEALRRM